MEEIWKKLESNMTMIDLFQTRQFKSTNNFIIMISILQAWLKTKASVCLKEYASTLCEPICSPDSFQRLLS